MSAVIDLQPSRYRPLVCVAVALETERRHTDSKILLRFCPLKQHILLVPALRGLELVVLIQ